MKLYLSSNLMGDRFDDLLSSVGKDATTAVIGNAVDNIPLESRLTFARTVFDPVDFLNKAGLNAFDLDLRDYFGNAKELDARLDTLDLVFVTGGNAFLLRRAMRQSGFDQIIKKHVEFGKLIYAGWSAGIVVAGPTLKGIEIMDAPDDIASGYEEAIVWDGLGLINYSIVPHFESDHPEAESAAQTALWLAKNELPHETLRDGEVIII